MSILGLFITTRFVVLQSVFQLVKIGSCCVYFLYLHVNCIIGTNVSLLNRKWSKGTINCTGGSKTEHGCVLCEAQRGCISSDRQGSSTRKHCSKQWCYTITISPIFSGNSHACCDEVLLIILDRLITFSIPPTANVALQSG